MINKIIKKFSKNYSTLSSFQVLLDVIFNLKILKVRSKRTNLGNFTYNLKRVINHSHENVMNNCRIDKSQYTSEKEFYTVASNILHNYGTLIVNNCFSKKEIDDFVQTNSDICPKNYYKSNNLKNYMQKNTKEIPLKSNKFIFDDRIIKILEQSSNLINKKQVEPINVRQPSTITYFEAKEDNLANNWTAGWHVDFPTQITTHIILENLKDTDTRMQVIPKSNKLLLVPGKHYILDCAKLKNQILDCFGDKGTLYIHSGNTLHRNYPVKGTSRYLWCQIYTMDKVFFTIDDHERSQILHDSETYFKNLCPKDKERIDYLINCPKYINKKNNKYFKVVKGNYIPASKSELTYL